MLQTEDAVEADDDWGKAYLVDGGGDFFDGDGDSCVGGSVDAFAVVAVYVAEVACDA